METEVRMTSTGQVRMKCEVRDLGDLIISSKDYVQEGNDGRIQVKTPDSGETVS